MIGQNVKFGPMTDSNLQLCCRLRKYKPDLTLNISKFIPESRYKIDVYIKCFVLSKPYQRLSLKGTLNQHQIDQLGYPGNKELLSKETMCKEWKLCRDERDAKHARHTRYVGTYQICSLFEKFQSSFVVWFHSIIGSWVHLKKN